MFVDRCVDGMAWREAERHRTGPDISGTATSGERDTVILLHGLGGSRTAWSPQLRGLRPLARVLAWDMPGYGASAALTGPVSFAALADAVIRFADAASVGRFHLVGLSMGGMVAQYVAAEPAAAPRLRSLTLLATSPKFGLDGTDPRDWRMQRLAALDAGHSPAEFAARVLRSLAGPAVNEELLAEQVEAMGRVSADALRTSIDCLVTHDARALLQRIEAPTAVVVGSVDEETPLSYAQALTDAINGARLHVIEGAGHLVHIEAPDAVNALIADQVRERRP